MSPTERGAADLLPRPPYERLREQLLEDASARERGGDPEGAAAMRSMVDGWWNEQEQWNTRVRDVLGVHHEINNALVGVRGNAQLMLINMAGQTPAVRERLEVVLRESGRIQEATVRLRELRQVLGSPVPGRTPRDAQSGADPQSPRERKGDTRESGESPARQDRRAASGCLWNACEAVLSSLSEPAALEQALDALKQAFDCDGVALHARSADGEITPWCARGDWARTPGDLREAIGVPLFRGRERVGALDLLARKGQRWRPEQLSLVRTASGALGAALGARLELEHLRRQPGRDPVTGLADARAFHHRLVEEMGRAEQSGLALAVVTLDLDHFAALNARFGEAAGDHVLTECALVLKLALREGDFVARLGGDEFGVVLPDCDLAPARRLAERLRHALEDHRFPRAGKISVSAGVAASPRDGMDPTELLGAAERALGLAKKAGRHRTAASGPTHTH